MTRVTGGSDRFAQWGWMWQRMKRLADLLLEPGVLAGATQIVEALDRWAAAHDVDAARVELGDAKFVRGLQYIEYPLGGAH